MKRADLEHVLRAAGAITAHDEIVVIGSQAILGSAPDAPPDLTASEEVDLYVPGDESASDLIDGSIGERSPFHETFGYYAHGVGPETAILPRGWRDRAGIVRSRATSWPDQIFFCVQSVARAVQNGSSGGRPRCTRPVRQT